MADKISYQTGNFSGSNWKTVEATGTQASRTTSTATTTSYAYIAATGFTPTNGVVCEGILLNVLKVSSTGTISVSLLGSGSGTPLAEVTINASDLPLGQTWVFFKFGSTVTFNNALTYKVGVKSDTAGNVNFYRSATSNDWARYFRTTSTTSPSASDGLFVVGDYTAAGTYSAQVITMDNTGSTTYSKLDICLSGTLEFGSSSSTAYLLKLGTGTPSAGQHTMENWSGGTFNMGTVSTPIPSTSSAILEFQSASSVQCGFYNRGTFNTYGTTKTISALLAADASAAATSLTTNISTSWLNSDSIVIASTTRTISQAELRTLSGGASGTSLTISSGLTNAHGGVTPYQAEIINLTRNVKIRGLSTTNSTYIYNDTSAIVSLRYTEIYLLGSGTNGKFGVQFACTTAAGGTSDMRYCSIYNTGTSSSAVVCESNNYDNLYFGYNVMYNIYNSCFYFAATSGTTITVDNCILIPVPVSSGPAIDCLDLAINITNCNIASAYQGMRYSEIGSYNNTLIYNNIIHSVTDVGVLFPNSFTNLTLDTIKIWRNTSYGLSLSGGGNDFKLLNSTLYGNGVANINITGIYWNLLISSCIFDAGVTLTSPIGLNLGATNSIFDNFKIINTTFGATNIFATADISFAGSASQFANITMLNCITTSSAEFNAFTAIRGNSKIKALNHDQQSTNHRTLYTYGALSSDTVIYRSGAISERLTPNIATTNYQKLESGPKRIKINSGSSATISAYVRKSNTGAGDANTYTGNQPVLMMRANPVLGVTTDTVIATATASSNGAWELLSGSTGTASANGVLEFYIICDGTVGWINIDDWAIS